MTDTLARPTWRVGQVLHPRHLLALEDALSAESARRAAAGGLPTYGVLRLEWSEDPPAGVVFVQALSAVFPGGTVVDVPDNARVRAPLDLESAGKPEVDVYVHIVDPPETEDIDDAPLPPDDPVVRRRHALEVSASSSVPGSRDRLLLGRFARDAKGQFRASGDVLPPLLRLDAAPLLAARVAQVESELDDLARRLDVLAAAAFGQDRPVGPIQRVRIEAAKLGALLDDVAHGLPIHPYWLFSALRAFALELAALDELRPPAKVPAYDHDRPRPGFDAVLQAITDRSQLSAPVSPRAEFLLDGGRYIADLPDDVFSSPEIYVAVLKRDPADAAPFDRVRLTSPERLRFVREYALRGVPVTPDRSPRARSGFGPATDFFRLGAASAPPGEDLLEWDHVRRERRIAFYPVPQLEGMRFVVCWRPA